MAEAQTAKLCVHECENLLATLKDTMDNARAQVEDAHQQIASIASFFDQAGMRISLHPLPLNTLQDHPLSINMDSNDSAITSDSDHGPSDQESAPGKDL